MHQSTKDWLHRHEDDAPPEAAQDFDRIGANTEKYEEFCPKRQAQEEAN